MLFPRVHWSLVPVAAAAGFAVSIEVVQAVGALLRQLVSEPELEALLRIDVRYGLVGAVAAFGTVAVGSFAARSANRAIAIALLCAGACAGWLVLGWWFFPEWHPLAYQRSHVPLILTDSGGVAGAALVWRRCRPSRAIA